MYGGEEEAQAFQHNIRGEAAGDITIFLSVV